MLFEIRNIKQTDANKERISWIRTCRDETGLGLIQAKAVYDWARIRLGRGNYVIMDTDARPEFGFLDEDRRIKEGWTELIKRSKSPTFHASDNEVDQILNKIGAKLNKPSKTADAILKQTAITLIRGGHIKHAKGVLEILTK